MSHGTTNLVPLDFETIKSDLKRYLSGQSTFKDIDFESSNIGTLIDVLAYNTYHSSFYMNMLANEMFLDTAQMKNSVTSHAKMLNYLPRSFRSAKAVVDITVGPADPTAVESILIPKGSSFTTRVGSNNYTFSVSENIVVTNNADQFIATNVSLYEGRYLTESYVYKQGARFVISNQNVDTDSIVVVVAENGVAPMTYTRATSFIDVTNQSSVYFIQPAENGQYEILFGDDVFGRRPTTGSTIIVEYRVSNGELANGAAIFESDGPIGGTSNVVIQTTTSAAGGAIPETNDEIRFRAPLSFLAQERAVSASDYTTLIRREFPEITKINVFGGEELDPPKYGYVALSMISDAYDAVSETRLNDIIQFISKRTPLTVTPIALTPEFTYVSADVGVEYDTNQTTKTTQDIKLLVLSAIKTFADAEINDFNSTLRYSKLLAAIDGADTSIISNSTDITMYKLVVPQPNVEFNSVIDFGNELYNGPTATSTHSATDVFTLYSTYFTFEGKRCLFEDDGDGHINISTNVGADHVIVKTNVGSIDYTTGIVKINNIVVAAYEGNGIRLYARTKSKDVSSTKNSVLVIKDNDINISAVATRTR